jgi:hypothetical protein
MHESSESLPPAFAPNVPMTFGQILDRTYRLMQKHYRLFLGIAAVPAACALAAIIAAITVGFVTYAHLDPQVPPGTTVSFSPLGLFDHFLWIIPCIYPIMLATYALYLPAAFFAAAQADRGVAVSFRQAYSVAWSLFGRSLWLMVLFMLYLIVPIVVIAVLIGVGAALMGHGSAVGSGPAYAFFLIPLLVLLYIGILIYSVLIMLRFAVAYPACIEEDLPAWNALKRSASLTSGAKGRIFLVLLVVYAVVYAVEIVCILVFLVLAAFIAFAAMVAHVAAGTPAFFTLVGLGIFGYAVVIGACILLSYAAFTTALALLYHDQRLRKDALAPAAPLA